MLDAQTFNENKARRDFEENILPIVKSHYELDGVPDIPARRMAWSNYLNSLTEEGIVPNDVVADWEHPYCVSLGRL